MSAPSTVNGVCESHAATVAVALDEGQNGAAEPRPGEASTNGVNAWDGRGRFTKGNPGRPRHRTGAPSPNGDNGGGTVETAGPAAQEGREAGGRFAKGNLGGPGNPSAWRVAAPRQALLSTVTERGVKDLAVHLMLLAHAGDVAAMKLLFAYVLGRPAETVDPDTLDLKEWQLYQQSLARPDEVHGLLGKLPPDFVLVMLRAVLPAMVQTLNRQYVEVDAGLREEHGNKSGGA